MSLDEWVAVALLGKTRGLRGELTALALSGKPERYEALESVFLFGAGLPEEGVRYEVESTWFHNAVLVFKFRGVDTISEAERLSGAEVRVPLSQRTPLEPGEYFESDLLGCEVVDRRTGESLGRVTRWDDGGSSGLLVVAENLLIPFARSICVEIDPAAKRIAVDLPEGLKDLNR
ncbi:MAG TPA: ribosome maturation factor RimM [Candidatus Acidoferrales bacterium]|nr:ribosome maturation factor RimM [Candidatus Acidoferrales bacterium]